VERDVAFFFKQWGEHIESADGGVFDANMQLPTIGSKNKVVSLDGHVPTSRNEMEPDTQPFGHADQQSCIRLRLGRARAEAISQGGVRSETTRDADSEAPSRSRRSRARKGS
jgi:hypothetical protein